MSTHMEQYGHRNWEDNPNASKWKAVGIASCSYTHWQYKINQQREIINTEFVILKIYNSYMCNILFNLRLAVIVAVIYARWRRFASLEWKNYPTDKLTRSPEQ